MWPFCFHQALKGYWLKKWRRHTLVGLHHRTLAIKKLRQYIIWLGLNGFQIRHLIDQNQQWIQQNNVSNLISDVFIVNFEPISHIFLLRPLLICNKFSLSLLVVRKGYCPYYKCPAGSLSMDECYSDNDCNNFSKCCQTRCGRKCLQATMKGIGQSRKSNVLSVRQGSAWNVFDVAI